MVYVADATQDEVHELYSVPLAGGPVLELDPLSPIADVSSFQIDPGSASVAYLADHNRNDVFELFLALRGKIRAR